MNLKIDSDRVKMQMPKLGINVRAQNDSGSWETADITVLTAESLLEWLKSKGGDNPFAENLVGIIFGHGHLHENSK